MVVLEFENGLAEKNIGEDLIGFKILAIGSSAVKKTANYDNIVQKNIHESPNFYLVDRNYKEVRTRIIEFDANPTTVLSPKIVEFYNSQAYQTRINTPESTQSIVNVIFPSKPSGNKDTVNISKKITARTKGETIMIQKLIRQRNQIEFSGMIIGLILGLLFLVIPLLSSVDFFVIVPALIMLLTLPILYFLRKRIREEHS